MLPKRSPQVQNRPQLPQLPKLGTKMTPVSTVKVTAKNPRKVYERKWQRTAFTRDEICDEFAQNPERNPMTGYKIGTTGKAYKDLVSYCEEEEEEQITPEEIPRRGVERYNVNRKGVEERLFDFVTDHFDEDDLEREQDYDNQLFSAVKDYEDLSALQNDIISQIPDDELPFYQILADKIESGKVTVIDMEGGYTTWETSGYIFDDEGKLIVFRER